MTRISVSQIFWLIGIFTLLAFVFSIGPYLLTSRAGPGSDSFGAFFANSSVRWIPWGFLGVLVVLLVRRFPFVPGRWPVSAAVHIVASIFVAFNHIALTALIRWGLISLGAKGLVAQAGLSQAASYLNENLRTYWIIVAVVTGHETYRRFRDREQWARQLEHELAMARLRSLRIQIEPHYLFNTLNAVSAMITGDPRGAEAMLSRLGLLIRSALDLSEEQEIPVQREAHVLGIYADIMRIRFPDRLRIEFDIAPETAEALCPSFIIQPLVENAIRHGLAPKVEGGYVRVASRAADGNLELVVSDDGVGWKPGSAPFASGGLGLRNVQKRIELLYGDRAGFRIENRPGGGVEATLVLPFHTLPRSVGGSA